MSTKFERPGRLTLFRSIPSMTRTGFRNPILAFDVEVSSERPREGVVRAENVVAQREPRHGGELPDDHDVVLRAADRRPGQRCEKDADDCARHGRIRSSIACCRNPRCEVDDIAWSARETTPFIAGSLPTSPAAARVALARSSRDRTPTSTTGLPSGMKNGVVRWRPASRDADEPARESSSSATVPRHPRDGGLRARCEASHVHLHAGEGGFQRLRERGVNQPDVRHPPTPWARRRSACCSTPHTSAAGLSAEGEMHASSPESNVTCRAWVATMSVPPSASSTARSLPRWTAYARQSMQRHTARIAVFGVGDRARDLAAAAADSMSHDGTSWNE